MSNRTAPLILIVEDNRADVFLIREAIAAANPNARVHVEEDGHRATQFIDAVDADESAQCPELVILDLNLPKKTGSEVLAHLRASRRCRYARVMILTSSDSASDRASVSRHAPEGYFRKPSEYDEFLGLGAVMRGLLAKPPNAAL